jgi:hypothetical protein
VRAVLISVALCLCFAAPAAAALERTLLLDIDETGPVDVDLDGDGAIEQVSAPAMEDGFLHVPTLKYACGERAIGRAQERNAIELLSVPGGTDAPLLAVFGSSGASGRLQSAAAHRLLEPATPGACPELKTVFRFPHRTARTPRPPRGTRRGSTSTAALAREGRVWFRTIEGLYRRSDSGCCPRFTRTTLWRPRGDGYVIARTRLRRLSG